ncbi:Glucan synthase-like 7 [Hibiscus syriacus]|uniref:Glucan synthase-like 7 n=1 Tax=Hibiscus syriacus TaxID=106335 RepID=A0A6A2WSB6_HIBSY|nr:Glucan synthase-like 7 [Hibiscus syriacus]
MIGQALRSVLKSLKFWDSIKELARAYEYIMCLILFMPIAILSWFPFLFEFQTRLLFNQAFSRGLQISMILAGRKEKDNISPIKQVKSRGIQRVSEEGKKKRMMSLKHHNSNSASLQSLSFEDVADFFSLPLDDAASTLGVCASVLKKICRENGLDRWPHRKFLAGKSIEEIKKHADRERRKEIAELSKAHWQSWLALFVESEWCGKGRLIIETDSAIAVKWIKTPEVCPTVFSQLVKEIVSVVLEHSVIIMLVKRVVNWEADSLAKSGIGSQSQPQSNEQPKLQDGAVVPNLQQQGAKNIQMGQTLNFNHQSLMIGTKMSDEFKFGFPSDGLSVATNKWWGSSKSDGDEAVDVDGAETEGENKHQSKELPDDMANDKPNENGKLDDLNPQGSDLLAAVRKRLWKKDEKRLNLASTGAVE